MFKANFTMFLVCYFFIVCSTLPLIALIQYFSPVFVVNEPQALVSMSNNGERFSANLFLYRHFVGGHFKRLIQQADKL